MRTISVKLPDQLLSQFVREAKARRVTKSSPALLTCAAVLTEAAFLLKREGREAGPLFELLERGAIRIAHGAAQFANSQLRKPAPTSMLSMPPHLEAVRVTALLSCRGRVKSRLNRLEGLSQTLRRQAKLTQFRHSAGMPRVLPGRSGSAGGHL